MQVGKLWQRRHLLIDLGVILHRAGPQRIEPVVHPEVIGGEVRIMTHYRHLVTLRQLSRLLASHVCRYLIVAETVLRQRISLASFLRELEDQVSI